MARIKAAVSAFVPRFFLRKMGYTSIVQVTAGDATNVALAMLFSDIRRFTAVSEGMDSSDLFEWVQGYFKRMTTIVDSRRGNVNQFVGDALFAVFSTANDALQCAVDMQADVEQLNVQRRRDDQNIMPIEVGIGIHHDVVALGILGDDKRHTCTAISASVNLASRLEGLTKQLGCKIIASGEAMGQLTAPEMASLRCRKLGGVVVKGTLVPTVVHDVFHSDDRDLQMYKQATRADFEALMNACIYHDPDESTHDVLRERLSVHVATATTFIKRGSVSVEDPAALHTPSESYTPRAAVASPMLLRSQDGHAAMPRFTSPQESPHAAEIDRVLEALSKYAVRDLALEGFCALADGSGSVGFVKK
jgi:class 3 adenylate cyclase